MGLAKLIKNIFSGKGLASKPEPLPGSAELEKILHEVGPSLGINTTTKKKRAFAKNK